MDNQHEIQYFNGSTQIRHQWLVEEDILIAVFVDKFGTKRWNIIAEELKDRVPGSNRNGKQCRERWHNHLDPKVRKSPWNVNEEFIFIESHKIHGNKWAEISKYIPGRTDNSIKNHFYSTLRKLISRLQKFEITNDTYRDETSRQQTSYFIQYLRRIMIMSEGLIQTTAEEPQHAKQKLAQFDIYLIRKLKENNVTLTTITNYLRKLDQINDAFQVLLEQNLIDPSILGKAQFDPLDYGTPTKLQKLEDGSKKILFKIEKDPQRLIEKQIKIMNLGRKTEKPLISFSRPEPIANRIKNINERKKILDIEYQAEIQPEKFRRDMYEMLKKITITPRLNKNGLLDDLQNSFKQEQKESKVQINLTAKKQEPPKEAPNVPKEASPVPKPAPVPIQVPQIPKPLPTPIVPKVAPIEFDQIPKLIIPPVQINFNSNFPLVTAPPKIQNFADYKYLSKPEDFKLPLIKDIDHQRFKEAPPQPPIPKRNSVFGNLEANQGYSMRNAMERAKQQLTPQVSSDNYLQIQNQLLPQPSPQPQPQLSLTAHQALITQPKKVVPKKYNSTSQNMVREPISTYMPKEQTPIMKQHSLKNMMDARVISDIEAKSLRSFDEKMLEKRPETSKIPISEMQQTMQTRHEFAVPINLKKSDLDGRSSVSKPVITKDNDGFKEPLKVQVKSSSSNPKAASTTHVSSHEKQLQKMNQQIQKAQDTHEFFIRRKSISMNNTQMDTSALQQLRQLNMQYQIEADKEQEKKDKNSETQTVDENSVYKCYKPDPAKNITDPLLDRIQRQEMNFKNESVYSQSIEIGGSVSQCGEVESEQGAAAVNQQDFIYNQQKEIFAQQFNLNDLKSHFGSSNALHKEYPTIKNMEIQSTLQSSSFQAPAKQATLLELQCRQAQIESSQIVTQSLLREALSLLKTHGQEDMLDQVRVKILEQTKQIEGIREQINAKGQLPKMDTVQSMIKKQTAQFGKQTTKDYTQVTPSDPDNHHTFQFKTINKIRSKFATNYQRSMQDESSFSHSSMRM